MKREIAEKGRERNTHTEINKQKQALRQTITKIDEPGQTESGSLGTINTNRFFAV